MWKVYNASTRNYQNVSDKQLLPALQSGNFRLGAGERVRILTPDGEEFEGDNSTDWKALPVNWNIENSESKKNRELQEEYGDSPVLAGAAAAARGATFGLSDAAASALGFGDDLQALKQANPTASTLGEIGGAIGSSVLLPGGGLVGAAGKAGAKLSGTAARALGTDLGAGLAKGAVAGSKDLAKRATARAFGAGAEGAAYGLGQTITEASLGDPKDAAENLVSNMGLGALVGGAGSATFGAFGDMFRRGVGAASQSKMQSAIDGYAEAIQKVRGIKDEEVNKLFSKFGVPENAKSRQQILDFMKDPEQAKITFSSSLEGLKDTAEELSYGITGTLRKDMVDNMGQFRKSQATAIFKEGRSLLENQRSAIRSVVDSADGVLYDKGLLNKLTRVQSKAMKNIRKGIIGVDDASPQEVYKGLLDYRKELDSWTKKWYGKDPSKIVGTAATTKELTDRMRVEINDLLRNERVFGHVALAGKKVDGAVSQFLTAKQNFFTEFASRKQLPNGMKTYVINPSKVNAFFQNPDSARNFMKTNVMDDFFNSIDGLLKVADERGVLAQLPDETKMALKNAKQLKGDMAGVRNSILGLSALQSYTGKSLEGLLLGSVLGGAVAGPLAPMLAGAGWALNNPVTVFRVMSRVEDAILKNKTAMGEKVNRFIGGLPVQKAPGASSVRAGGLNALSQLLSSMDLGEDTAQAPSGKFEDVMYALQKADPMKISENVTRSLGPLNNSAPGVAASAVATSINAIQFLQEKAPKAPFAENSIFGPLALPYEPSTQEKASFERTLSAVMDPVAVLQDLDKGTLMAEHVEALKAVYPMLYQQVQTDVANSLTEKKGHLSYQKKLQLSVLLDLPTVPELQGDFLVNIQTALNTVEAEKNNRMSAAFANPQSQTSSLTGMQRAMT